MDQNIFQRFPKIGDKIVSGLDLPTLLNCTLVCKDWNRFLNNPFFWLKKLQDVGQPREIEEAWKILIKKSEEIGVEKQSFTKCLKRKFQHFVESKSQDPKIHMDATIWMKFPPLHTASLYGEIEIVKLIYHFELDFNRPIHSGRYKGKKFGPFGNKTEHYEMAIFAAIENGHTEVVKFLANTSRELQSPSINCYNLPQLYVAILHKNFELVKFLVPRTQNLNKLYGMRGCARYGLIHECVRAGDTKILKYLVSIPGFDPNIENDLGKTALQELCRKSFHSDFGIPQEDILEMIEILAQQVDANNPMNFDVTYNPIHLAVTDDSNEILKILVNYLNVNVKNGTKLLPIDVAVRRNQVEAVKILAPFTKDLKIHDICYYPSKDNSESLKLMKSLIDERNRMVED